MHDPNPTFKSPWLHAEIRIEKYSDSDSSFRMIPGTGNVIISGRSAVGKLYVWDLMEKIPLVETLLLFSLPESGISIGIDIPQKSCLPVRQIKVGMLLPNLTTKFLLGFDRKITRLKQIWLVTSASLESPSK